MENSDLILGRFYREIGNEPPAEIMIMPAGVHTIEASNRKGPVKITVQVTPGTASALNRSLQDYIKANRQRPFFDFDHDNKGAAGWPTQFAWRDAPEPGVYAAVEWSESGSRAISGKDYRAFSPMFYVDDKKPSNVVGAPINMGGLVNDPAFKTIRPIWAKQNGDTMSEENKNSMALDQLQQQLAAKEAELIKAKTEAETLKGEVSQMDKLKSSLANLEAVAAKNRKERAETYVREAVQRGVLAAKDSEAQSRWVSLIESDEGNALLLAKMPGNDLSQRITSSGSGSHQARTIEITGEDPVSELKEYGMILAKNPQEAGEFYSKNIAPRIAKEERLPILAAQNKLNEESIIRASNTTGTLSGSLVTQRVLETLGFEFPVLSRITTDFSDEPAYLSQAIYTRYPTLPTVASYTVASGYANTSTTMTDASVTLDHHQYIQLGFNETELASTPRNLIDEWADPVISAMGDDITDHLYALITNANFSSKSTETIASVDRATLIECARLQTLLGVPQKGRTMIISPTAFAKLAEDTSIVSMLYNQAAGDAISTGRLPMVHGYTLIEAANLGDNGEHLEGFCFTKSALLLVTRLPNDFTVGQTGGGTVQTITDANTGLSLQLVKYIDWDLGQAKQRIAWMFGVGRGQPNAGTRLVHA